MDDTTPPEYVDHAANSLTPECHLAHCATMNRIPPNKA